MPFTTHFPSPIFPTALTEIQRKYGDARASLVRIRADRLRLARTGWRPRVPNETKLIRTAEWQVEATAPVSLPIEDFDLEARFVPTEDAFADFAAGLERTGAAGRSARVFLRGLELDEPRFTIAGRPVAAAFFDIALALSRHPDAIFVLPKVDGYLEARFWAEVARSFEAALALPRNKIRFAASIETLGGAVEAEEILFELKDSVVGLVYDARYEHVDALRLDSGLPALPREDVSLNPWVGIEIAARAENLEGLARKRGVRLDFRTDPTRVRMAPESVPASLTLDSLRGKVAFAFRFLRDWHAGDRSPEGKDWVDFELARALVWTAIQSGFLREEIYETWCAELGTQPFSAGSAEDAAMRTLDPLVRTALFPDSAKTLAFSILLDREKMRSVNNLRLA